MHTSLRIALGLLLTSLPLAWACDSSNDPANGPADAGAPASDAAAGDAGSPADGGPTKDSGGGTDGGGTDAGGDAGIPANPTRIVHLADTPARIDLCYSSVQNTFAGEPILKSLGLPGVPASGVSAPFTPPAAAVGTGINYYRVVDAATGSCATSVFDSFGPNLDIGFNKMFVYVGDGSVVTSQGQIPTTTTAGKDTVIALGRLPYRLVKYVSGAETIVPENNFSGALLDGAGSGTIVTTLDPTPNVTRNYKPLAGGLTLLIVSDTQTLACDLLAPAGGITPCSATIRAN